MPISAVTSAYNGLVETQTRLNDVASRVAHEGAQDAVSLSMDAVALLEVQNAAKAQANVLTVTDEMQKSILATIGGGDQTAPAV